MNPSSPASSRDESGGEGNALLIVRYSLLSFERPFSQQFTEASYKGRVQSNKASSLVEVQLVLIPRLPQDVGVGGAVNNGRWYCTSSVRCKKRVFTVLVGMQKEGSSIWSPHHITLITRNDA